MKKILPVCFLIALTVILSSCNNDRLEGDEILNIDAAKIDSVQIAQDTMDVFSTQTIKTYANYTQNCEGFYGYDYLHISNLERKVISYKFKTDANCEGESPKASQINFRPQTTGTFLFRFFAGKDASGEDNYIERNIVVK